MNRAPVTSTIAEGLMNGPALLGDLALSGIQVLPLGGDNLYVTSAPGGLTADLREVLASRQAELAEAIRLEAAAWDACRASQVVSTTVQEIRGQFGAAGFEPAGLEGFGVLLQQAEAARSLSAVKAACVRWALFVRNRRRPAQRSPDRRLS